MKSKKILALTLRKTGASYNEISKKLFIPKSTLSSWFHGESFSRGIEQINRVRIKSVQARNITIYNKERSRLIREGWKDLQEISRKEIGPLSDRDMFLLGIALYWAEGYKKSNWNMSFCNSDPKMIKLMMSFFVSTCSIPKEKIKIQAQYYPNHDPKKILQYWSKVTGVPLSQFNKPICAISKSSKLKRGSTLPFGTIRLRINDVNFLNKMKGWIEGVAR